MTRLSQLIATGSLALSAALWLNQSATPTVAFPSTSPSAREAARLKYRPPAGWIRHYLGDDRYKIMGGTWKVVSTELDSYYYPAWAPEMLRQPAGKVIGFSSAKDAEEAGYRRSHYPMELPTLGASASDLRDRVTTVNRSGKAMRITLADGASTVMLPPNWRRTQSGAQTIAGQAALADTLQPLKGKGSLQFATIKAPLNLEPFMNATAFPKLVARVNGGTLANTTTVSNVSLGGRSGVLVSPKGGNVNSVLGGPTSVIARGTKAYVVINRAQGTPGVNSIISSFQPH